MAISKLTYRLGTVLKQLPDLKRVISFNRVPSGPRLIELENAGRCPRG